MDIDGCKLTKIDVKLRRFIPRELPAVFSLDNFPQKKKIVQNRIATALFTSMLNWHFMQKFHLTSTQSQCTTHRPQPE